MKEQDETKKAEMKKKMESETLPSWLKMMEGLLTKQGGNYFAGSQLTWADIAVYSSIDMIKVSFSPRYSYCIHLESKKA